jgi:DNA-binding MarR family transcriptional regulator
MQNSKSYFLLPNTAFGLSSEEFSVLAYLLSIPTAKKRVRQQTIAEKCNIGSRNTVTKAINSLLAKGYIFTKIRTRRVNYWYGSNIYYLNEDAVCDFSKGYTLIQRSVFEYGLSPAQLKVYAFIAKSINSKLGYCWNSYTDISKGTGMSRSTVIALIHQLEYRGLISKIRKMRYGCPKVYADNVYCIKLKRKKRIKKEVQPRKDCTSQKSNVNYNLQFDNNTEPLFCQVLLSDFLQTRGSPKYEHLYITQQVSHRKRKVSKLNLLYSSIYRILRTVYAHFSSKKSCGKRIMSKNKAPP